YLKGQVTAYICVRSRFSNHQCHLAFRSVPADVGVVCAYPPIFARDIPVECGNSVADLEGDNAIMFLGVTELVQKPEGIPIPSFVWLETAKQRYDFRRNMFADSSSRILFSSWERLSPKGKLVFLGLNF